jgi:ribonuclease R
LIVDLNIWCYYPYFLETIKIRLTMIKSSIKKAPNSNPRSNGRPTSHNRPNKSPDQRVIFGTYEKRRGQDVVVSNNVAYPIADIKVGIPLPIMPDSSVKALLRSRGDKQVAVLLRVFGPKLTLKERIFKLLDESEVRKDFPEAVVAEAEAFPDKVSSKHKAGREDLTDLALCTIDGESAKDFDDAVFARVEGKNIEVTVAIADVSYYVKEGTSLDEEAFLRGTSIYYPGHCVPMLPEKLSNGLCSLKPNVLRLSLAVSFEVGQKGAISKPKIKQALIKSAARLTYNQVQDFYDTGDAAFSDKIVTSLLLLKKAAHILRKNRQRRGAIDFDITESVVALDDIGEPLSIHPQDRLDSHRIIEDLMVATNEIVARFCEQKKWPCLYRVHEAPDQEKLANFFKAAQAFGALGQGSKGQAADIQEPKDLQKVMVLYQNSKYQSTLNNLMLRAMMQARYSEENLMHFGLASDAYLHFTSPIRRYADLMVHRQLRNLLFEQDFNKKIPAEVMQKVATSISEKEVKATDLERKVDRLFSATFMATRVGDTFPALIVSCTEFGMFVRIIEHHVEGLVHISSISRSHVNFVPERMSLVVSGSQEKYMVGDKILVKLTNVNIDRGHVDFELVKPEQKDAAKKKGHPKGSRNRGR